MQIINIIFMALKQKIVFL